jgi:hypothetical protein
MACAPSIQAGVGSDVLSVGNVAGSGFTHGQRGGNGHDSKPAAPAIILAEDALRGPRLTVSAAAVPASSLQQAR